MAERLSLATIGSLPAGALRVDPNRLAIGIVHLGVGAFHRAHQAAIVDETIEMTGDERWGISAVTMRSEQVVEQLAPQDGLYSVTERGAGAGPIRVIGAIREVLSAPREPEAVVARLADPAVAVVTLTVTEKGYRRDGRTGGLDLSDPGTVADLGGAAPTTTIGLLVRGLDRRRTTGAGPISVVCCDNLPENGVVVRRLVADFVDALGAADLGEWIASNATFPSTMVDRITPATTADDLADVADGLGLEDRGAVLAEPFRQWVVEDDFAGARPDWERAGVQMVSDVLPWESAKLRLLNATHSLLAYTGLALGIGTIAEAVSVPALRRAAERLQRDEVVPTLIAPEGLDARVYGDTILERFRNPALGHTTRQVGSDGSQKLAPRLADTITGCLAAGRSPRASALAVAGWMLLVATGAPDLSDPLADRLSGVTTGLSTARDVAGALLGQRDVFPPALAVGEFPSLVAEAYDALALADTVVLAAYLDPEPS
ncbi:mannitol dehydrogenase family protein [Labedella endophytica]|uniref:Mannitol dehydrogenase family protein n=1 Tax=Labedella endophytica TaxID=1523160 RepID=A0A3S0VCZ1_9MICO|nr:mannitol dehydrogenase family protein [Labedella endophytica]RUR03052.1 mannitol dehydrogenase family protein [Labedella endophytica]